MEKWKLAGWWQVAPAQLVNLRWAAISEGKTRLGCNYHIAPPPNFTTPLNSHPEDHHPYLIFSFIVLSVFWVIIEFVSKEISTRVGLISMGKCHPPKFSDGDKRPSVLSCFLLLAPQIWTSPKIHPRACIQDGNEGRGSSLSHKKTEHGHRNSGQQGTKHVFVSKLLAS